MGVYNQGGDRGGEALALVPAAVAELDAFAAETFPLAPIHAPAETQLLRTRTATGVTSPSAVGERMTAPISQRDVLSTPNACKRGEISSGFLEGWAMAG